ncbi:MAG: glycine cleavage system protein H [Verrucomicrobiales bacterium]
MEFLRFKHARFSARFPASYHYSRSHYWMAPSPDDPAVWRVGFTKFATRMLGELVEAQFTVPLGAPVEPGQEIGAVEGFKAAASVFSVMHGSFAGLNPALSADACLVKSDPYEVGWLYAVRGRPEEEALSAEAYLALLHETIARMAAAEHAAEDV